MEQTQTRRARRVAITVGAAMVLSGVSMVMFGEVWSFLLVIGAMLIPSGTFVLLIGLTTKVRTEKKE